MRSHKSARFAALVVITTLSIACRGGSAPASRTPSVDEARAFLAEANETMLRLSNEANQAGWVQGTYITVDTEAIYARASEAFMTAVTSFAKRAAQYDNVALAPEERRQLAVLKNALTMAAPADSKEAASEPGCASATAIRCRPMGRFPRISWATSGPRTGPISTTSSRRGTADRPST
jgi:Angiotensin-converting enzyme